MEKEKALDVIKRQIGCYKNSEEQCFTLASCRGCKYNATIEEIIEAMQMAISALEFKERYDQFWEEVKAAGMKGEETEIRHSGRVFRIREVAQ